MIEQALVQYFKKLKNVLIFIGFATKTNIEEKASISGAALSSTTK